MITPSSRGASSCESSCTSASEETPPEAITDNSVLSIICFVASTFGPVENAVARYIGIDDELGAEILQPSRQLDCADIGLLSPARYLNLAVTRIDSDCHVLRSFGQCLLDELLILHSGGSQDDALNTRIEKAFDYASYCEFRHQLEFSPSVLLPPYREERRCFFGLPSNAPSRSTTCSQSAPF